MTLVGGTSTVSAVDVGTFYHYEVSVPFTMTGVATFASGGSPVFTSLPLSGSGIASAYVDVSKAGFVLGSQKTYTFAPTPEPASFALAGVGLAFFFLRKRVQN